MQSEVGVVFVRDGVGLPSSGFVMHRVPLTAAGRVREHHLLEALGTSTAAELCFHVITQHGEEPLLFSVGTKETTRAFPAAAVVMVRVHDAGQCKHPVVRAARAWNRVLFACIVGPLFCIAGAVVAVARVQRCPSVHALCTALAIDVCPSVLLALVCMLLTPLHTVAHVLQWVAFQWLEPWADRPAALSLRVLDRCNRRLGRMRAVFHALHHPVP